MDREPEPKQSQEPESKSREEELRHDHDDELIDLASEESFPASDPPSFAPLRPGAPKRPR